MCSRYNLTSPSEAVRSYFGYQGRPNLGPRYNIAPTQPVAIVRPSDDRSERELAHVRWGLIPSWVKDPAAFTTLINARGETLFEKPSFRAAARRRRCLFPADGFYEWMGPKGQKRAFLIRPKAGGLMGFAGVWEHFSGPDGEELESAAIVTTEANEDVAAIHNRMPVILDPSDFDLWLNTDDEHSRAAGQLIAPAPLGQLEVIEIDRRIGNSAKDDSSVLEFVEETQDPGHQERLF